jgi:hypothetical protein
MGAIVVAQRLGEYEQQWSVVLAKGMENGMLNLRGSMASVADNVRKSAIMPSSPHRVTRLKRQGTLSSMDASAATHAESWDDLELSSHMSSSSAPSTPTIVELGSDRGTIRVPRSPSYFADTQVLIGMSSNEPDTPCNPSSSRAMSTTTRQTSAEL